MILLKWSNRWMENKSENVAVSSLVLNYSSGAGDLSLGVCRAVSFMIGHSSALQAMFCVTSENQVSPFLADPQSPELCFLCPLYLMGTTVPNYYKKKTEKKTSDTFKQWLFGVIWSWGERPIERSRGNHKRVSEAVDLPGSAKTPFFSFFQGRERGVGDWGVAEETAEG